jgi:adenosylcobinamide kinase / adenosylcobinamide-phosphate guanylyltransferase
VPGKLADAGNPARDHRHPARREYPGRCFLLDCVTLLVTNLVMDVTNADFEPDETLAAQKVDGEIKSLLEWIEKSPADWIVVSNEVGLGLVPENPLRRVYRDILGWANRQLAKEADEVYFMAAGIPVPIHTFRGD